MIAAECWAAACLGLDCWVDVDGAVVCDSEGSRGCVCCRENYGCQAHVVNGGDFMDERGQDGHKAQDYCEFGLRHLAILISDWALLNKYLDNIKGKKAVWSVRYISQNNQVY